ncbi:ABC transporter permease [Aminobacterium sp. EBM-42]|jgi:peptide/nickel transport system permease protein|uniref:ABC transporter permease n=3 Tax=Aminobacteriaceae TaxID=3029087 RepID=UPI00257F06D5|nr:ABC transporter permease [Aminobacterium sp. EBM-42]
MINFVTVMLVDAPIKEGIGMIRYILKRFIFVIPVLLGATFLVFAIMNFTPGDPARIIAGNDATEIDLQNIREKMGLNDPFLVRYGRFIVNAIRGDLGTSYRNNLEISSQIIIRLKNTMILAASAVFIAIIIGIPVGIISAIKQYSTFDNIVMVVTLFLAASPVFWMGLILVLVFSLMLGILPAAGMQTGFPGMLKSLILPAFTLSTNTLAVIARTTRASMLEVVRQDYIDTARAKGLKETAITIKHMLPNALIPILTIIGINFGSLLGGSVVTESIFAWPGVGRFIVESISFLDTPSILASVVMLSVFSTFINLFVDLLYAYVDPRIKSQYKAKR